MNKNISSLTETLSKNNRAEESYNNKINSAAISLRKMELENRSKGNKVSSGVISATGNNKTVKNVITTTTGEQKVLAAIQTLMDKYPGYNDGLHDIRTKGASVVVSDNLTNYPYRVISDSTQVEKPTYVASDPDKPDDSVTSAKITTKTSFDVNNLYENVKKINPYENVYVDIGTKKILSDKALSYFDEGIVTQTSPGNSQRLPTYRLTPSDQIKQDTTSNSDIFSNVSPYTFNDRELSQDLYHERTIAKNVAYSTEVKYKYLYCFNNISLEHRSIENTAGSISKPITVNNNSYLELTAETTYGVEYSIIDGQDEIPILPKDLVEIVDEKLFFGMMPRFTIMNSDDITVKRNGVKIGITSQKELELFLMADTTEEQTGESSYDNTNLYTITYKPSGRYQRYFPKSEQIKVKVIQRILADQVPKTLGVIKIVQHNIPGSWYLDSKKDDNDYNPIDQRFKAVQIWNT